MTELLKQDSERAERLMAMGQMAASLAHEIRNPLGSMELFCTLLKKDLEDDSESLRLANQIHTGIRTLDRIISNCLQFSRDISPRVETIADAETFFGESIEDIQQKLEESGIEVQVQHIGDGNVRADPYLLRQVLSNLLSNAVDATAAAGRVDAAVYLDSEIDGTDWKIQVRDTGIGIPREALERIFDPFYSTKENGTGLGLPIVYSIVRAHGGELTIESEARQGTVVQVRIPQANFVQEAL